MRILVPSRLWRGAQAHLSEQRDPFFYALSHAALRSGGMVACSLRLAPVNESGAGCALCRPRKSKWPLVRRQPCGECAVHALSQLFALFERVF